MPFLVLPPEVRIMIYKELLILHRVDESGQKSVLHIRSMTKEQFDRWTQLSYIARTRYSVPGREWTHSPGDREKRNNPEYQTTYCCLEALPVSLHALLPARPRDRVCGGSDLLPSGINDADRLHPAIIATNKRISDEAAQVLYQNHIFDFGDNYAAGQVFIQDHSRVAPFLREVGYQKHILPSKVNDNNFCNPSLAKEARFWSDFCCTLRLSTLRLKKLHLHLVADTVPNTFTGPRTLSTQELQFLLSLKTRETKWIVDVAMLRGRVEELEIVESQHPIISIGNPFMLLHRGPQRSWNPDKTYDLMAAAMAGSISTSVAECLKERLGI
ncbi:hypothetical protein DL546_007994 [Coniochaeta pulveracea]|uniref:Uncharacterized protein n=1 Tax=Coniochaeta pulveracea TaxID=177199 RepID=A0A420YH46_9PEZI|nr:hypothetical protein DL546_007994 [Coniochaeta pulveracea]